MTDKPKGYWIAHVAVDDAEGYEEYKRLGKIAYDKFGATFVVRGGQASAVEGETGGDRHVVIAFQDYETALACYNSPEYAAARAVRQKLSKGSFVIVEGA